MADDNDYRPRERYIQMALGALMWAWMAWEDHHSNVALIDMSSTEVMLIAAKYAFAAILIKGITAKELLEFIRAWRGKDD